MADKVISGIIAAWRIYIIQIFTILLIAVSIFYNASVGGLVICAVLILVALVNSYAERNVAREVWLRSHFSWQICIFLFGLLFFSISVLMVSCFLSWNASALLWTDVIIVLKTLIFLIYAFLVIFISMLACVAIGMWRLYRRKSMWKIKKMSNLKNCSFLICF